MHAHAINTIHKEASRSMYKYANNTMHKRINNTKVQATRCRQHDALGVTSLHAMRNGEFTINLFRLVQNETTGPGSRHWKWHGLPSTLQSLNITQCRLLLIMKHVSFQHCGSQCGELLLILQHISFQHCGSRCGEHLLPLNPKQLGPAWNMSHPPSM
jgi:hypothetical protein